MAEQASPTPLLNLLTSLSLLPSLSPSPSRTLASPKTKSPDGKLTKRSPLSPYALRFYRAADDLIGVQIACTQILELDPSKVNVVRHKEVSCCESVNDLFHLEQLGGAVALGHAVGSSGSRIVVT